MRPIFIGGCDRSGTTMLGSMLGVHTHCVCVPESQFLIESLSYFNYTIDKVDPISVFQTIEKHPRFKLWNIKIESDNIKHMSSYPELIEYIIRVYNNKYHNKHLEVWIDHTPANIMYATTLNSLFLDTKMIHLVRDGRAVASSLLALPWGPKSADAIALFWLQNLAYGFAVESYYGKDRVMRVKYEDLVTDPQTTLAQICSFIGLDFQQPMLNGNGFHLPVYTRNQHALVGKRPDSSRINAWENKLTLRQIEIFEYVTGDMLQYLGYNPKFGITKARKMTFSERVISRLKYFEMLAGTYYDQLRLQYYGRF